MDIRDIKELTGIIFSFIYLIVKPISSYHFIKLNNKIYNNGIDGEARLLEVKKMTYNRIPPVYSYIVVFYLYDKQVKISSRMNLPSSPGTQNELIKIKYWEGYPYDVYICNINYKYTYIVWLAKIICVLVGLFVLIFT